MNNRKMAPDNNIRSKWLTVRMTEDEYKVLDGYWKKTTCGKLSDYVRKVVLRKAVYVKYRNSSADDLLAEIITFRKELKAIGVNYNQVVHKLHTLDTVNDLLAWMIVNERHKEQLFSKMKEIQDTLNKIYSLWLQSSPNSGATSGK